MVRPSSNKAVYLIDENGVVNKVVDGKIRVSAMPYTYDIAEGNLENHWSWSKIGFNGALVANTEAEIWSKAGSYAFPTTKTQMEIVSSSAQDAGTTITTGTSSGGTTTSLIDASKNFISLGVDVGDCIILDKSGTTPEWGYVTAVEATRLIVDGFSLGGSGSDRSYAIIDKSASTGAQALKLEYLDDNYEEYTEIVISAGAASATTVALNILRINSFRVIAAGSDNKAAGNITLRGIGGGTTYSYITLGYTRARNIQYTVPAGKKLYITSITAGYAYAANQTYYCRIYTRANIENQTKFHTGSIFFPYTEFLLSNSMIELDLKNPTPLPEKTDIKVSAVAGFAGAVTVVLRGWLEE